MVVRYGSQAGMEGRHPSALLQWREGVGWSTRQFARATARPRGVCAEGARQCRATHPYDVCTLASVHGCSARLEGEGEGVGEKGRGGE